MNTVCVQFCTLILSCFFTAYTLFLPPLLFLFPHLPLPSPCLFPFLSPSLFTLPSPSIAPSLPSPLLSSPPSIHQRPSCVVLWVDAVLFVFSLANHKLIGWYKMGGKVTSVCCHGDSMYVVCGDGEGVYHLRYCALGETLRDLSSLGLGSQIVKV